MFNNSYIYYFGLTKSLASDVMNRCQTVLYCAVAEELEGKTGNNLLKN